MRHETAGDPMTSLKWTHKTTAKIAEELSRLGINVGANTVARLLRQMGYSLKLNHKKLARVSKTPPADRNAQFVYIDKLRENCAAEGRPLISIDTKKKEAVGQFKNDGTAWNREAIAVNDHDFLSDAIGKAVPYGIYDLAANCGTVFVGSSKDTAEFAVETAETDMTLEQALDQIPAAGAGQLWRAERHRPRGCDKAREDRETDDGREARRNTRTLRPDRDLGF